MLRAQIDSQSTEAWAIVGLLVVAAVQLVAAFLQAASAREQSKIASQQAVIAGEQLEATKGQLDSAREQGKIAEAQVKAAREALNLGLMQLYSSIASADNATMPILEVKARYLHGFAVRSERTACWSRTRSSYFCRAG